MVLADVAYFFVIIFIRTYKWIELQLLKLFSGTVKKIAIGQFEKLGVVFHFPDDPPWRKEDDERVLSKCIKYDSICHFKVHNPSFFTTIANQGTLAFGEMYMKGQLEFSESEEDLTQLGYRMLDSEFWQNVYLHPVNRFLNYLELSAFNLQTSQRAWEVGKKHYDLGNDMFKEMLDPWMQYTCGYWKDAKTLNEAQLHKIELIAKKLDLKPGMKVLDIGCGWGGLCKYLAENHGVSCVGITISKDGVEFGKEFCKNLPVDIRLQDYRDISEKFDRIVSVGMFEHVGLRNYRKFFKIVNESLEDDGIFLLHSSFLNHENMPRSEPFTNKYIFPNGMMPFHTDVTKSTMGLFIIEDWHNFGLDYAETQGGWRDNFIANWPKFSENYKNDVSFYRMWVYHFSMAKAIFLSRRVQLLQIVLSKNGLQREYRAAR